MRPGVASTSPFLEGNYAPVHEEVTVADLPVVGRLPPELDGLFVRNGPNPQFPPRGRYHWFDGDGMLHGVRLRDGQASYRNRYVRTKAWHDERRAGKALWGGLLDPPGIIDALHNRAFKNAANTSVVWHHGKLLALWEVGEPHEITVPDLDTVGLYTFGGKLQYTFTAHPKIDPQTGEMLAFGTLLVPCQFWYGAISPDGRIVHQIRVGLPRRVMMHDFAITANYAVFMDLPFVFHWARLLGGGPMVKFEPRYGARFGILPRRGQPRDVKWFEAPPCYVFHTLNAYEDGDEVVLLGCRRGDVSLELRFATDYPAAQPRLHRWRFNLRTGGVCEEPLDDLPAEFPRVADTRLGRPSQFGYASRDDMTGLLKYDLVRGGREDHAHGPGRFGGEAVFVPRPGGRAEDDGWLLTYVYDQAVGRSELVVIDAADFRSPPVARVLLPTRVPYGFHGTWIDGPRL